MAMTASEIQALKTRITAEFTRRNNPHSGSLVGTSGTNPFTTTPAADGYILTE